MFALLMRSVAGVFLIDLQGQCHHRPGSGLATYRLLWVALLAAGRLTVCDFLARVTYGEGTTSSCTRTFHDHCDNGCLPICPQEALCPQPQPDQHPAHSFSSVSYSNSRSTHTFLQLCDSRPRRLLTHSLISHAYSRLLQRHIKHACFRSCR